MEAIRHEAKEQVLSSRNLREDFKSLASIEEDLEQLSKEKNDFLAEMYRKVFGEEPEHQTYRAEIDREISDLQRQKADELLLAHDLGQRISRLQEEKEQLSDAILLVTNIHQVIDLWDKVTYLMADQAKQPEQELLFAETSFQ